MILSGGVYISKDAAEELLNILDLSSQMVDLLEADKHIDDQELTEVQLRNALDRGANAGLSVERFRKILRRGDNHD